MNGRNGVGKGDRLQFEMSYNRRLSASLFEPKFPRGTRFLELGRRDAVLKPFKNHR
jgi:hypothetical protein